VLKEPASYILPAKYPIIHQAALAACDSGDGLKDGLIDDPTKCKFDPKVLLCKSADGPECLTAAQVEAAKKIYSPAINPRTGKELFASLVPGTELGWGVQAQGPEPSANIYDQYRYVVFKDPKWDWKTFDFDKDVVRGDLPENLLMNATDPEHEAVLRARWKAVAVPRLERSERSHGKHDQILQERGGFYGRAGKGVGQHSTVP
jgi:feruloyl esterase